MTLHPPDPGDVDSNRGPEDSAPDQALPAPGRIAADQTSP